jgi:hypothetical protein
MDSFRNGTWQRLLISRLDTAGKRSTLLTELLTQSECQFKFIHWNLWADVVCQLKTCEHILKAKRWIRYNTNRMIWFIIPRLINWTKEFRLTTGNSNPNISWWVTLVREFYAIFYFNETFFSYLNMNITEYEMWHTHKIFSYFMLIRNKTEFCLRILITIVWVADKM